jgi:hypothetical protein
MRESEGSSNPPQRVNLPEIHDYNHFSVRVHAKGYRGDIKETSDTCNPRYSGGRIDFVFVPDYPGQKSRPY